MPTTHAGLAELLGSEHVRPPRREELADASGRSGRAAVLVAPPDAEAVARVVRWCAEHGVPLTVRGGGTGWDGGAVPTAKGTVLLDLRALAAVRVDPLRRQAWCGAGATLATVARRAREAGLRFGIDAGAAEDAQVGGAIATDARGPHSLRHGSMRDVVSGLEAVLGSGELVREAGAVRRGPGGLGLTALLPGSDGRLGVVTGAWLRLTPAPAREHVVAAAFRDAEAGQEGLEALLATGIDLAALDGFDAGTVWAVGGSFPGGLPHGAGFLLVAGVDTSAGEAEDAAAALEEAGGTVLRPPAAEVWQWRYAVPLGVATARGALRGAWLGVPSARLAEATTAVVAHGAAHGLQACSWGHVADGLLRVGLLVAPGDPEDAARADAALAGLPALAARLGGSTGPPDALAPARAALEATLDPVGILRS